MNISQMPHDLNQFRQLLDQSKAAGQLDTAAIETARKALNELPVYEQEQALDYLEHHLSNYATADAKASYSLNPELSLKEIISALPPAKVPEWLQTRSQTDLLINLTELQCLEPAQRKAFIELASEARDYYHELASGMRSGSNYATANRDTLDDFINRANAPS